MLSCLFGASGLEARGQQVLAKHLTGVCIATNPGQLDPDLPAWLLSLWSFLNSLTKPGRKMSKQKSHKISSTTTQDCHKQTLSPSPF